MRKFLFILFAGLVLAQDPPTADIPAFKEPVITIANISSKQLAGIVARHKKDGPKGTDPLKWYLSRVEFELNLWASESVEQSKEDLGRDVEEFLSETEKTAIKEAIAIKRAAKEAEVRLAPTEPLLSPIKPIKSG